MKSRCRSTSGFVKIIMRAIVLAFIAVSPFAAAAAVDDRPLTFVLKWGTYGSGNGQFNYP